jgi:hypothetical protein
MSIDEQTRGLSDVQRRAVDVMLSDGIAVVRFVDLFEGDERWQDLYDDIRGFAHETEERLPQLREREDKKSYIARRFYHPKSKDAKPPPWNFAADDRWLQLGLSSEILQIVNGYRGERTYLIDLDNWYTIPDPGTQERVRSQQWHRDPWDNHIVKVFIYFSDVDEQAGPFEYVRGSAAGGPYGHLWPWVPKGIYPPQDEFESAIPAEDRLTLTGPAGTIIFCDTSGFHCGGSAKTKPRILSYHTYVSAASKKPARFRVDVAADGNGLSEGARFALSRALKRT